MKKIEKYDKSELLNKNEKDKNIATKEARSWNNIEEQDKLKPKYIEEGVKNSYYVIDKESCYINKDSSPINSNLSQNKNELNLKNKMFSLNSSNRNQADWDILDNKNKQIFSISNSEENDDLARSDLFESEKEI